MEDTSKPETRPPAVQYRLVTFSEDGTRMSIMSYDTELALSKAAATVGRRQALACSVDYLVNGGDEGSLRPEDLKPPERRAAVRGGGAGTQGRPRSSPGRAGGRPPLRRP